MKQQVELNSAELASQLNENGMMSLRNILFDTGKALSMNNGYSVCVRTGHKSP